MDKQIYQKINILEMHPTLSYAGGQRNMVTFARYLRKDVFNVYVLAYKAGGPLETVLKQSSIPYLIAGGDIEQALGFIRDNNIDVIHMHRSGAPIPFETDLINQVKKIKPQMIVIEKNVFGKYDPSLKNKIDCSFFQSMMHLNERYLVAAQKDFDFDKEKVLHNMVDKEEFASYIAHPEKIAAFKSSLGIGVDDFVVGKVARPALEKWSDLIIEMMPYVVKKVPNIKVVIIGCPVSRARYIEKSVYRKYFRLLPETSDQSQLHLFYQSIDVLAHSSKIGECNGNTINEAMYWSKPVLVNSTPRKDNGQLEQIKHRISGIIANTPPTMARAIAFLVHNPQERIAMGMKAHQQVITVNDPRFITQQVEKFLVEKLRQYQHPFSLSLWDEYAKINYNPDKSEIVAYRSEYRQRLLWDFGSLTLLEKLGILLLFPRRFYLKGKDFVTHKLLSYAKR